MEFPSSVRSGIFQCFFALSIWQRLPASAIACPSNSTNDLGYSQLNGHAPRDFDSLSIDPTIIVSKQRCNHWPDVVWNSHATKCRHVSNPLVQVRVVAHHPAAEIGGDCSGGDRVNRNATHAKLLCQVAGQNLDRAFHGGVAGRSRKGKSAEP